MSPSGPPGSSGLSPRTRPPAKAAGVPTVRRLDDAETVARAGAGEWVRLARAAAAKGRRFRVALSGGSTPKRLYALLAAPPFAGMWDPAEVEYLFGDERAVAPDAPESNYRMARETLLDAVKAPAARVHRMEGERADLDAAATDYEARLARVCGTRPRTAGGPPPALDLVLLGLGPDGHTASLFPHAPSLGERERWVVAADPPAPPVMPQVRRLTVTLPLLARAAHVVFLVEGEAKAEPLAQVLEGPRDPDALPAQAVAPAKGRLVWLVDRAAASRLERTEVVDG